MHQFLKLGVSLVTDKTRAYTARHERLARLASEVRQALDAAPDLRLVVGHGSGSFGHWAARPHGTRPSGAATQKSPPPPASTASSPLVPLPSVKRENTFHPHIPAPPGRDRRMVFLKLFRCGRTGTVRVAFWYCVAPGLARPVDQKPTINDNRVRHAISSFLPPREM
jgi:hypothetical protein